MKIYSIVSNLLEDTKRTGQLGGDLNSALNENVTLNANTYTDNEGKFCL